MRLNYYRFSEEIGVETCLTWGCTPICGCELNSEVTIGDECCQCDKGFCFDCEHNYVKGVERDLSGISVTEAKRLLSTFGGKAWTSHIDRDGSIFETTPITLKGNNSRFYYNQHL